MGNILQIPIPPGDGLECTGATQSRMAIPVSTMNIAFHDKIGHEPTSPIQGSLRHRARV